jgi:hypothetical protein
MVRVLVRLRSMVRLLVRFLSLLVRLRSMVRLSVPLSPVLPYRLSVLGLALSGPVVLVPAVLVLVVPRSSLSAHLVPKGERVHGIIK